MYEKYWGFSEAPFTNRLQNESAAIPSPHEEALARLLYCVEQRKSFALLYGPAGCGKSQLLKNLAQQTTRTQRFLVSVHAASCSDRDFWEKLRDGLYRSHHDFLASLPAFIPLRDELATRKQHGIHTVIMIDQWEDAKDDLCSSIQQLVQWDHLGLADLTVVAAVDSERVPSSFSELSDLIDLGIEVAPLEPPETRQYIQNRLQSAGREESVFRAEAIEILQSISGGVPREINRLCDLALLAGMNEFRTEIDDQLIREISRESQLPVFETER